MNLLSMFTRQPLPVSLPAKGANGAAWPLSAAEADPLHGDYQRRANAKADWRENLAKEATHKALNIPVGEDVEIHAPRSTTVNNNGFGLGAVLAIIFAILLALGLGAAVVWFVLKPNSAVPAAPSASVQAYDQIVEELQPDGSWKEVKRERLK